MNLYTELHCISLEAVKMSKFGPKVMRGPTTEQKCQISDHKQVSVNTFHPSLSISLSMDYISEVPPYIFPPLPNPNPNPPLSRMLFQRHRRCGVLGGRLLECWQAKLQIHPQLYLSNGRRFSDRRGQNPSGCDPVQQWRTIRVQPEHALDPTVAAPGHRLAAIQGRRHQDRYIANVL